MSRSYLWQVVELGFEPWQLPLYSTGYQKGPMVLQEVLAFKVPIKIKKDKYVDCINCDDVSANARIRAESGHL